FELPVGPGGTTTLAALELNARFALDGSSKDVTVNLLRASWIQRGLPIEIRARAVAAPDLVTVMNADIQAGGSHVRAPLALYPPKGGSPVAALGAGVRGADAFLFWPHGPPLGNVKLAGFVPRRSADAPLESPLSVDALRGRVTARVVAEPDPPALRG